MRSIFKISAVVVVFAAMVSCRQFQNPFADNKLLAEVGRESLYMHDVTSVFTEGMTPEDSLKVLRLYVDQWVRKQLKVREAEVMFASSQEDIDRMVEEYRNSLLTYKVDQFYVDSRLDTLFTDRQIAEYYDQHKSDFILDKTILKARIAKVPEKYRQMQKIKDLMASSRPEDYRDFMDICIKNGFELTEFDAWTELPGLLARLPVDKQTDYAYLANEGKLHELKEDGFVYLVKTLAHRDAGDYVPLESVTDVIRRVIFNQRKQEIIRTHEDSLYRAALENRDIIVNVN